MSDVATIRATVESAFGSDAAPLLSLLRPSLRLVGHDGDAHDAPVRLGGPGVLGRDESWPMWGDRPLTFLAVFNCAAVHALLPESALPASGIVTAWVHRAEEYGTPEHLLGGASSRDRDASRLVHHPPGATLREEDAPAAVRDADTARRVPRALVRDVMWPLDLYSLRGDPTLGLTDEHVEFAEDLLEQHSSDDPASWVQDRIGGWPTLHDAADAVALVDAGVVDDHGWPAYRADGAAAIRAGARQHWQPLVQLAANLDLGWNWFLDGVLLFLGRAGEPVDNAIAYCSRQ